MKRWPTLLSVWGVSCVWGLVAAIPLASQAARASNIVTVDAPIVGVVPLVDAAAPICDVPPPERSAGLVATLRWDLEGRCRPNPAPEVVRGYQVDYEWDGRRFSTQMDQKPEGDTLSLQLEIY